MITVLTYGTFDLLHVGHVIILKRLHELGVRLIVGVSSDEFNDIKGKKIIFFHMKNALKLLQVRSMLILCFLNIIRSKNAMML